MTKAKDKQSKQEAIKATYKTKREIGDRSDLVTDQSETMNAPKKHSR